MDELPPESPQPQPLDLPNNLLKEITNQGREAVPSGDLFAVSARRLSPEELARVRERQEARRYVPPINQDDPEEVKEAEERAVTFSKPLPATPEVTEELKTVQPPPAVAMLEATDKVVSKEPNCDVVQIRENTVTACSFAAALAGGDPYHGKRGNFGELPEPVTLPQEPVERYVDDGEEEAKTKKADQSSPVTRWMERSVQSQFPPLRPSPPSAKSSWLWSRVQSLVAAVKRRFASKAPADLSVSGQSFGAGIVGCSDPVVSALYSEICNDLPQTQSRILFRQGGMKACNLFCYRLACYLCGYERTWWQRLLGLNKPNAAEVQRRLQAVVETQSEGV